MLTVFSLAERRGPAADAAEEVDRLRLPVERQRSRSSASSAGCSPAGRTACTTFFILSFSRIDQHERHVAERLRLPVREDQPRRSCRPRRRTCPSCETIVATLSSGSGTNRPFCGQELQQVGQLLELHRLLEALGHERLVGLLHRRDLVLVERVPLGVAVDDLDRGRGRSRRECRGWCARRSSRRGRA